MIKHLNIDLIIPDPEQPRQNFKKTELFELKDSIQKEGILNPLIVESNYQNSKYLILDGERRYRCSIELGLKKIPTQIIEGPLSKEERTIKRFHIQLQHADWTELEKAKSIYEYKKATKKTLAEIAEELNLHVPKVHAYLSVLEFTNTGQKLIEKHQIDFTYLLFLIRIVKFYVFYTKKKQEEIEEKIINKIIKKHFIKTSEISEFSQIMKEEKNIQEKIEFLDSEENFEEFKEKIGIVEEQNEIFLYKKITEFDKILSDILNNKYKINKKQQDLLLNVLSKINSLS